MTTVLPPLRPYIVRARETRVHEFRVQARSEEEAKEIVEEFADYGSSLTDQFDSNEVMDATLESDRK